MTDTKLTVIENSLELSPVSFLLEASARLPMGHPVLFTRYHSCKVRSTWFLFRARFAKQKIRLLPDTRGLRALNLRVNNTDPGFISEHDLALCPSFPTLLETWPVRDALEVQGNQAGSDLSQG
ncbi:hypothetical protein RRG08_010060 [Elysia crispata]|uniref:Uncharacterized protein n=1 Tax=Elysia crispata TaxID=231223 RepID=A0AAE1ECC0_9GAST|nr:hypothetical protein RRG08_010060 [Elysia crispata]